MARTLLAALALLAGLLVAPTAVPAAAAEADGPTYQMPTAGSCLQVTVIDYFQMTPKTPVDCATEHTVVVTAVAVLPEDTDWTVGSDDLEAAEAQYCMPGFYDTLGGAFRVIAKTAYLWRYAIPNAEQRSHGASWIRCDLNMSGALSYLPLPQPLLVGKAVPRDIRSCLVVQDFGMYASSCGDTYDYELQRVFTMPAESYPTDEIALAFAKEVCPAAKRGKKYRALWSFEPAWTYGDHIMRCYKEA